MKSKNKMIPVIIVIAVVLAAVAVYIAKRTPFEERRPTIGDIAPQLALSDLSGNMISLGEQEGDVVLVNFWASWCPPCKSEMKWFQKAYEEYHDEGFAVVAVSLDNVSAELVMDLGITFPVVVANDRVKQAYGDISDVPASFLVGRDGTIVKKVRKVYAEKALRADVEAALKAPMPSAK